MRWAGKARLRTSAHAGLMETLCDGSFPQRPMLFFSEIIDRSTRVVPKLPNAEPAYLSSVATKADDSLRVRWEFRKNLETTQRHHGGALLQLEAGLVPSFKDGSARFGRIPAVGRVCVSELRLAIRVSPRACTAPVAATTVGAPGIPGFRRFGEIRLRGVAPRRRMPVLDRRPTQTWNSPSLMNSWSSTRTSLCWRRSQIMSQWMADWLRPPVSG